MAPSECHGSNCRWGNGIFTPSFKSGGEVASSPLNQGEEHRQAFSKEGGAGNQGGTDNLMSRGNVRQVHPAAKWDSVSGQVPHSQQPIKCCQQVRPGECHEQVVGQTKVAIQAAPLLQKTVPSEQDQDPIDSQVSTGKVQLRMGYNNILLSPLSLMDVQQASKSMEVVIKPVDTAQSIPQPPLQKQEEGQALIATDVCQKPEMGEFPIPLQAKPDVLRPACSAVSPTASSQRARSPGPHCCRGQPGT